MCVYPIVLFLNPDLAFTDADWELIRQSLNHTFFDHVKGYRIHQHPTAEGAQCAAKLMAWLFLHENFRAWHCSQLLYLRARLEALHSEGAIAFSEFVSKRIWTIQTGLFWQHYRLFNEQFRVRRVD
jgi:hypothetical protein